MIDGGGFYEEYFLENILTVNKKLSVGGRKVMSTTFDEEHFLENILTAKITERGQVTVPKELRERLHLSAGREVALMLIGEGLLLLPQQPIVEEICNRLRKTIAKTGKTEKEILATLPEARRKVFETLYGEIKDDES